MLCTPEVGEHADAQPEVLFNQCEIVPRIWERHEIVTWGDVLMAANQMGFADEVAVLVQSEREGASGESGRRFRI
jgi:hypothetical protein